MKYEVKIEWLFLFFVYCIVTAIFFMTGNKEVQLQAAMALIGTLGTVLGYLFGKSQPDKPKL